MALFPCSICQKRYAGKSNKAYVGWNRGIYSDRQIMNLCAFHIDMLREQLVRQGALVERNGDMLSDAEAPAPHCVICTTDPVTTTWWAQLYDRSLGKEVFVVEACDRCTPNLAGIGLKPA